MVAVVPLGEAIGVCHHCYPGRHAWWQVRPSHYLLVHRCRGVGSAVRCSAGGRGGGGGGPAVASAPHGRGPAAIHPHGGGRQGSHAAHASRHSSQSGAGLRALGPRGSSGGAGVSRTRWTPVNGGNLLCSQEGGYPVPRRGRREGGAGYSCCPIEVCRGYPQDPFRDAAGREDEEEQGGARALLPEDLPPVVGTPGSGEGGGQVGSRGNASHTMAYGGVSLVPSYTGMFGRRRAGSPSAPSTNTVISPTSRSSSAGCRRWSAASSSDPPGYVARAWFRYGAASPG